MHEGPTEDRLGELGSLFKNYYYYIIIIIIILCYGTFRISGYMSKTVSDLFMILLLKTFSGIATYGFVSV